MAFEEGKKVLACPSCNAQHLAKWSRMPVREYQCIRCQMCGGVLVEGKSVIDYYEVLPIKQG